MSVAQLVASGARLFIAALAFSAAAGVEIGLAIGACAVAAGLYTRWGGLRAVVWTDALQAGVFVAGAAAALSVLVGDASGGLAEIWAWASESDRTRIFHTDPWISLTSGAPLGSAIRSP